MIQRFLRTSLLLVAALAVAALASGQSTATVTVPVTYTTKFSSTDPQAVSADFSMQLTGDSLMWYSGLDVASQPRVMQLDVGRRYELVLTGYGEIQEWEYPWGTYYDAIPFDFTVSASTTGGYAVYVQNIARGMAGSTHGYVALTIVVGPEGGCHDCGPGRDFKLKTSETRVEWSVDMGRAIDNEVIKPIRFATKLLTLSSITRAGLNFTPKGSDVTRVPVQGTLQQVRTPNALLNAVDITSGFELRFYTLDQVGSQSGGVWQLLPGATPYVTYRFKSEDGSNPTPSVVSFTRIIGSVQETHLLDRDSSSGYWSVVRPGAEGTREVVKDPTNSNIETVTWRDASQNIVKQVTRTFAEPLTGQRELVQEVDALGRTRSWTYLGDTGFPGSKGKLNITKDHRGGWQNIAYYNEATWASVGQIHRIYRPYKDTPNGTDHSIPTLQTGFWSEYQWETDINGVGKLLASRVDKVGSTVVGKETATHNNSTYANNRPVLTSTYLKHVDSNPANALTTIRQEYAEASWIDPLYHGRPYAVVYPDRSQVSWVQQRGTWNGSTFTANTTGIAWREVEIRGSADSQSGASLLSSYLSQTIRAIYVMPGNSTLTIRIRDGGNLVREELHICSSGNTFEWAGRIDREYSATGVVKKETRFDPATSQQVVLYDSSWTNGRMDWERDSSGVKRNYLYDAMGRVWKVTTEGVSGVTNGLQHSRTTTYTYDAAGQVTQIEVKGAPGGTLISKRKYDLGGYLIESEEPGVPTGRKTTYAYELQSSGRWKVTTTLPGDPLPATQRTRIEQYFRDGRLQSITGTAEIARSFDHWINSGGDESHSRSPFVQHWQTDWAGRRMQTVGYRPDNETFSLNTDFTHNNKNQLLSIAQTGSRTVRFGYNPLLGWTEEVIDVNANGQIDYAGMDPIRTADVQFVKTSGHWWRVETSGAFATDNSTAHSEIAVVETRLSGYSGTQLSQVRTKDVTGSATLRTTTFDWAAKKLETVIDYPSTTNHETVTARNGQVEKVTTAQGLLFGVKYDQFGREIGRTDPRKGDSELEFVSGSNDVWRVRNEADKAANRWTVTYTYNSAGRVATETKLLGVAGYGMVTRYDYSLRGELTHRWGNGATPVRFEYNSRGQRTKMHTYRSVSPNWNDTTWPPSPGTADTTEWVYATNSGVLTGKKDATNNQVGYTYHPDGQVNVRTWARGVTTTYTYNDARQLYSKSYNDGTPTVTFTQYNRRGQLVSLKDGTTVGAETRGFAYDSIGFMQSETLPAYFGSGRSVQWQRDGYGRRTQVALYAGSTPQFTHDYGYDGSTGRLINLTSASPVNGNPTSRVTSYEHHTNSNEWRWMRNTWASHDVERTLESNRDAVNVFVQKTGTYKAIEATYTRDALGRLATSKRDNTNELSWEPTPLFRGYLSDAELKTDTNYTYTERDELTKEDLKAYVSSTGLWQSVDKMGKNRMSQFTYDNAQNRETATVLGLPTDDPTPNALNQPNTFKGAAVSHDLDGNMTSDGTWSYAYDGENRLKSCSKTGLTITYAYDFMGRRVEMKSDFGSWNFTKRFVWDGWNLIADMWGPVYGYAIAATYVWGIDVSGTVGGAGGVGGLALMYYNGRAFIPLQDGRGNIHGYLDTTTLKNAVSWDFTAYGETIHERGGSGSYGTQDFLFRYQSKMQDMSGHLLYFGHRYYHPGMGRFVNRDPIGEAGGLNLYGYVRNNPGNRWDYLGLNGHGEEEVVKLPGIGVVSDIPRAVREMWEYLDSRLIDWANSLSSWWVNDNFSEEIPDSTEYNGPAYGETKEEEWKPTKENCDQLRNGFWGFAFSSDGKGLGDIDKSIIAAAFQVGVATERLRLHTPSEAREYHTEIRSDGSFYAPRPSRTRTGGLSTTEGGVVKVHSHNIGLESYRLGYGKPTFTEAQYIKTGGMFSPSLGDIETLMRSPTYKSSVIFTPAGEIRQLDKDDNPNRWVPNRGKAPRYNPSPELRAKIFQCLMKE